MKNNKKGQTNKPTNKQINKIRRKVLKIEMKRVGGGEDVGGRGVGGVGGGGAKRLE